MKFGITDIITTVVNTPGRALARSFIDNVIRDRVEPVIGSILYCDLALGYIEHSGIYVGGGNKCIVELHNDNGTCIIQRVSPEEFTSAGTGFSIYVSCEGTDAVGGKKIAKTARSMVGKCLGRYSLTVNNCHMFSDYCLRCADKKTCECYEPEDYVKHFLNGEMTLTHLKQSAREIIGADNWRVWKRD